MRTLPFALTALLLSGCVDFRKELFDCFDAGRCLGPGHDVSDAGSADAGALACNSAHWCFQSAMPVARIGAMLSFAPDDVWAFGEQGYMFRFDGTTWTQVPGQSGDFASAAAVGPDDFYVGGSAGLQHWDGSHFTTRLSENISYVGLSAANDLWAYPYNSPNLKHWNGATWANFQLPSSSGGPATLYGLCAAGGELWAVGDDGLVLHATSSADSLTPFDAGTHAQYRAAWCSGPTHDVWVGDTAANSFKLHPDGTTEPFPTSSGVTHIVGSPAGDVYVVDGWHYDLWTQGTQETPDQNPGLCATTAVATGDGGTWFGDACGQLARLDHGHVTLTNNGSSFDTNDLYAASGTAADDIWVSGESGTLRHFDGHTWSTPSSGTTLDLTAIVAVSPDERWAAEGNQGGSDDQVRYGLRHFVAGAWKREGPLSQKLMGLWVSPTGTVFAVGQAGTLLSGKSGAITASSISSQDLYAVSGTSDSNVWAVGDGTVLHFDGSTWNEQRPGNDRYWGVATRPGETYFVSATALFRITQTGIDPPAALPAFRDNASNLALADDGTLLVGDRYGHLVRGTWGHLSPEPSGSSAALFGAWLAPDAKTAIITGGSGTLLKWTP
jgi:hypothetical protein